MHLIRTTGLTGHGCPWPDGRVLSDHLGHKPSSRCPTTRPDGGALGAWSELLLWERGSLEAKAFQDRDHRRWPARALWLFLF